MNTATKPQSESSGKSGLFRTAQPSEEGCWESTRRYHCEVKNIQSDTIHSELCARLEEHQERIYEKIPTDTFVTAWDYLRNLKADLFLYGRSLTLQNDFTSPTAIWFSSHDELVVEWASLSCRISIYFRHKEASIIITKDQEDGTICTNDYEGLPSKDLAAELVSQWG